MNRAIGENLPFLVGEKMKIQWPLFLCISPEALAKLILYQEKEYHLRLDILSLPEARTHLDMKGESLEEIASIMCQPPSRSRGESG